MGLLVGVMLLCGAYRSMTSIGSGSKAEYMYGGVTMILYNYVFLS